MKKSRESMILYRSFYDAIKLLPDAIQLEIFRAIFEFGLDEIEPTLSAGALPFWLLIKPNLQANRTKWENGCKAKSKQSISKKEAKRKQKVSKAEANVDVDVDVDKDENGDEKVTVKGKLDLSGYGQMAYLVQRWIDYKKSIKDSYKSQQSLDMFYKNLMKYSGGNAQMAEEIIERSMANQWKGIFQPERKNNEQTLEVPAGRSRPLHESFTFTPNQ